MKVIIWRWPFYVATLAKIYSLYSALHKFSQLTSEKKLRLRSENFFLLTCLFKKFFRASSGPEQLNVFFFFCLSAKKKKWSFLRKYYYCQFTAQVYIIWQLLILTVNVLYLANRVYVYYLRKSNKQFTPSAMVN